MGNNQDLSYRAITQNKIGKSIGTTFSSHLVNSKEVFSDEDISTISVTVAMHSHGGAAFKDLHQSIAKRLLDSKITFLILALQ